MLYKGLIADRSVSEVIQLIDVINIKEEYVKEQLDSE